ncbi:MAG: glycosyltransferase 87 family protein [Chthoniobacteraceae bacterium]
MNSRTAIQSAAFVALVAKLACAALTLGTNDADAFYNFGRFIWEHGLLAQYRATPEFNHTPVTGCYCALIYGLGHGFGFNFLLRLPGILADFAVVQVLLRRRKTSPPAWALVMLALSPVSFMVSGFHGNVDGVLVWLLVVAALECGAGRAAWCGLWFGLACNVKIIPLLVAPVFFFHWLSRGKFRDFFLAASLTIFAGWSYPLVTIPGTFLQNVLGYSSNWGGWGITYWLGQTHAPALSPAGFSGLTPTQRAIMSALKVVIVVAAFAVAWRRRGLASEQLFTTLALVWAIFFVFAPGVGAQYLVWFAPFLLVKSARWFTAFTLASSVFLFAFYNTICGGLPWYHGASTAELLPRWAGWSNLPWLTLVAFLAAEVCRASGGRAYASESSPSSSSS